MPPVQKSTTRTITIRYGDEYARYLKRLESAVRKTGVQLKPGPNGLAEYLIVAAGLQFGLKVPARTRPAHRPSRVKRSEADR